MRKSLAYSQCAIAASIASAFVFFPSSCFISYMAPSFVLVLYIYECSHAGFLLLQYFFSCKCPDVFDLSGVLSSELSHLLIFLNIFLNQSAVVCGSFA
jgi:hypothetical protein